MKLPLNNKGLRIFHQTPSGSQTKNLMEAVKWPQAP